jgi:S-formylglutathione hydrolase FrmB
MPAPTKLLIALVITATISMALQVAAITSPLQTAVTDILITVTLDRPLVPEPVSGRLLVLFSRSNPQPITGPNWIAPEQFTAVDVEAWDPVEPFVLEGEAIACPNPLPRMEPGTYFVQAVLRRNPDFAHHKDGPGNLYSQPARVVVQSGQPNRIDLKLTASIKAKVVPDSPTRKIFSQRSQRLSRFRNRDVVDRALVLLPPSYADHPTKRYPVYYEVTGFGPTIEDLLGRYQRSDVAAEGVEFIHVMLTGQCQWGHHVYANSQTNGPRGDALVKEMIPAIESRFRAIGQPHGRMIGGHSSGGWSSLWLQTHYPKFFGGVYSTAPDPVDFRDWQGTDLYGDRPSVFFDADRNRRPLAVAKGQTLIWYDDFSLLDDVLERGGQLRSFEAVFSPIGKDGLPARCWDRKTGIVDPAVVDHWRQYDISQYLVDHWEKLKSDLDGKLNIYTGSEDTFLLTRAVELLQQRLQELGSDAQIEILPGRDHFDLIDAQLKSRIYRSMAEKFKRGTGR